jgi:uncharacterized protein
MADPIASDLLEILICPESRQKLHLADAALTERLRARQAQGRLLSRSGEAVGDPVDAWLVREDGRAAYPIVDQIPVLTTDKAVDLDPAEPAG